MVTILVKWSPFWRNGHHIVEMALKTKWFFDMVFTKTIYKLPPPLNVELKCRTNTLLDNKPIIENI